MDIRLNLYGTPVYPDVVTKDLNKLADIWLSVSEFDIQSQPKKTENVATLKRKRIEYQDDNAAPTKKSKLEQVDARRSKALPTTNKEPEIIYEPEIEEEYIGHWTTRMTCRHVMEKDDDLSVDMNRFLKISKVTVQNDHVIDIEYAPELPDVESINEPISIDLIDVNDIQMDLSDLIIIDSDSESNEISQTEDFSVVAARQPIVIDLVSSSDDSIDIVTGTPVKATSVKAKPARATPAKATPAKDKPLQESDYQDMILSYLSDADTFVSMEQMKNGLRLWNTLVESYMKSFLLLGYIEKSTFPRGLMRITPKGQAKLAEIM